MQEITEEISWKANETNIIIVMKPEYSTNIGIFLLKIVAKLPFPIVYLLADMFYLVVYYIMGYRKDVVSQNLKNSFPEKDDTEIKKISKKYFRHFSELMVETIKMNGMTEKDFRKRMTIKNPELVNGYFESGKSVVVLTMHYNNWEWSTCFPLYLKHKIYGVYKPLNNLKFDRYMNKMRSKSGVDMISNAQVLRSVLKSDRANEQVFTWLAGDQTPPKHHKDWFSFLNQDAMFYPGPAFISQKFDQPVLFQKLEKIGRGRYQTTFEVLCEDPKKLTENEIMAKYIDKMEEVIREKPEFYLWSHRRWKHKRPAELPLQNRA